MSKTKFPKQLFIARSGTKKRKYYDAEEDPIYLAGLISNAAEDDNVSAEVEIAVYEFVGTKKIRLLVE